VGGWGGVCPGALDYVLQPASKCSGVSIMLLLEEAKGVIFLCRAAPAATGLLHKRPP